MPIIKEDPMHRYDPSNFSFTSVKSEVSEAMQEDWKRDKVDDAKKRAIHDSKSYDEFKDRVAGCTLKPIHRSEFNEPPKFAFNRQAAADAGAKAATSVTPAVVSTGLRHGVNRLPQNGREFERELRRRITAADKIALLEQVGGGSYARLFGQELDAEMLRHLLEAFNEIESSGNTARRFLAELAAGCPSSTTTAASFFDDSERNLVTRLLVREPAADPNDDIRICAVFGVPPSSLARATAHLGTATAEACAAAGNGIATSASTAGRATAEACAAVHNDIATSASPAGAATAEACAAGGKNIGTSARAALQKADYNEMD